MRESSKTSEMVHRDPVLNEEAGTNAESGSQNGLDGIELLLILSQRKNTILKVTIAMAVITAIIVFLVPSTYTATASILPPEQKQSTLSAMLGQLGSISGLSDSDLGFKNPGDLFIGMLHSRTIQDRLIDKFDLRKVYRVKRYQDARKKLDARSYIVAEKEGLISISVDDHDPSRAAAMANAYVDELHNLNSELAISEAAQRRLFYEDKVNAERDALAVAEVQLKLAEEKTGLLQPDAQARVIIQSVADMRAQVAFREVQIEAMRTYATKDNPELQRAEQELAGLRTQLAKMERNTGDAGHGDIDLPTRKLPQAELEYLRRARDLKYHEALYEFLNKQLEAARIDEAKDAVVVQVVDKAVVPERKSGPHRTTIILLAALLAFLLTAATLLVMESLKRKQEQDPQLRARLALLGHYLRFS
ncbi:MAG TPA: Wzz/FepE/Etk N-terminal domain-containing protein [Verrucomicrobiae bacterium]|jgi:tyrosine-protein kinase Etk/Wzc|nr:Wzz/FepE/Etk N-terminal domain-containing protein [Verrucomicrobiae bacterium]